MPIEAIIVFFAGAIGIVAFTAVLTWVNAYAKGYADGLAAGAQLTNGFSYLQGSQETAEAIAAEYEVWKASH
jgi:hypothetical protein